MENKIGGPNCPASGGFGNQVRARRSGSAHSGQKALPVVVFQSAEELTLLRQAKVGWRRAHLVLCLPGLSQEQTKSWEAALNARFNDCGCSTGAIFATFALAVSIAWQFWHSDWSVPHWSWFLVRTLFSIVVAGVLGKLLGIKYSRVVLRRIINQVQELARPSPMKG